MDIAPYIVKFLIKNRYCSLPGLGDFELIKTAAAIKKESGEIIPAKFEVKFSSLGAIDDSFASFIAGFENVSISNTSNNIKKFCAHAKEEILQNGKFTITHLGYLTMQNGKITFQQTEELDMGASALPLPEIDTKLKSNSNKKLDFSYPAARSISYNKRKGNQSKMLIPIIAVLVLLLAAFFVYRYIANNHHESTTEPQSSILTPSTNSATNHTTDSASNSTTPSDTNQTNPQTAPSSPIVSNNGLYKVATFTFNDSMTANAKVKKLISFNNKVEIVTKDGKFLVVILASHPQNDTAKLVDSLRKFFNPKGQVFLIP